MRWRLICCLMLLLLAHTALAIAYLTRFPAWRAPDEGAHFAYIQHLWHTGELPIFYGKHKGTYEAHQSPLYYLSALPFVAPFLGTEKKHTAGLYVARGVSTAWAALVVVVAFLLPFLLGRSRPALPVAALAGAFSALLPMHLLVCASVGNDGVAGATAGLALLWLCRTTLAERLPPKLQWREGTIVGILVGIAVLAKTSNFVLVPLALIALLIPKPASGDDRSVTGKKKGIKAKSNAPTLQFEVPARSVASFLFAFLLVAGWWFWRNTALYGDPLGIQAFLEGFRDSPKPADFLEPGGRYAQYGPMPLTTYLMWVVQITMFTWLGIFGEPNEAVKGLARLLEGAEPLWHWVLIAVLLGAIFLITIALGIVEACKQCYQNLRERRWSDAFAHALPILFFLLVFLSFVQFNRHFFQAQARYFYPAHAAMAYLFAIGAFRIAPERWAWQVVALLAALLTFLAVLVWWLWVPLG